VLPAIQLHTTYKPNPYIRTNNDPSSDTFTNNVPHHKLTNISTKNGAKQSTSTPPPNQDTSQQATSFPTFGTIHTITGGSNQTFKKKKQKPEHYCQVNHVAVEGHIMRTKWLHIQITFTEADIKLTSIPQTDAMVITAHIDKWNVTRVLVDNGS
jgi:hypothetical protein